MKIAKKIACIGEGMMELTHREDGGMGLSYGGDTLNTAVYMSRLGLDVEYVTALGDDPYSGEMMTAWQSEGVGTEFVIQAKGRMPGLYAIRTDDQGERSFYYWRDHAPARDLLEFSEFSAISDRLLDMDFIYVSGITLSLYSEKDITALFELLDGQRARGGKVMFDSNYRANRWRDIDEARETYDEMLKRVDLSLPTLDDDQLIFGDADAEACCARHHEMGVAEVVVKMGAEGCYVSKDGDRTHIPLLERRTAKDTTGAGDSFNAGFLAARLNGRTPSDAATFAHVIAGEVIMHPGAIIPKNAMSESFYEIKI